MSSAIDSELMTAAEKSLAEAQELMGLPDVVVGGGSWDEIATRAKELLKRAWKLPTKLGTQVGTKIRDAARRGLDRASEASKSARDVLQSVALGAALLAASPGILLGLAAFLLIEGTGYGGRARRAGRRYVSQRARAYGL